MDVNNAGFMMLGKKSTLQMLYDEENEFNMFVGPQGYNHVLVSNTESKQNFCLFTRKQQRAPLTNQNYCY